MKGNLIKSILTPVTAPLSVLYGALIFARNLGFDWGFFRAYRSKFPVISIGNITVGGNGKTPLAMAIFKALRHLGHKPVILSRGYGGSELGPTLVLPEDASAIVGDEPKLMALNDCVVVVSKNKVAGLKFIENRLLGNVVILDDGFQSRYIARDLNLVSIESSQDQSVGDVVRGRLLPWGRLREGIGSVAKRATAIVLNVGAGRGADLERAKKLKKFFYGFRSFYIAKVVTTSISGVTGVGVLNAQRVNLLTSIANPEKVVGTLEDLGFKVENRFFFADHHKFDISELIGILSESALPVVCTEKDSVKLLELKGVKLEKIFVARIKIQLEPDIVPLLSQAMRRISV